MEMDRTREQMHQMELQIKELTARVGAGSNYAPPPNSLPYNGTTYSNGHDSDTSRTLPPIMNGNAMQGVQYGENGR